MLSEKDAKRVCEILNSEELTDEELDMVVGGSIDCRCDKECKEYIDPLG